MTQTVPNYTNHPRQFVVGTLPACPSWCESQERFHHTFEHGSRMHSGPVGSALVSDAEGVLEFCGTIEQHEDTVAGTIRRSAPEFLLMVHGRVRDTSQLVTDDSAQLRELAELIVQGAAALDAAHATAEAVLS
jgi:phytoene dehydrogenase-like protein